MKMKTLLVAIDAKYIHKNVAVRLLKANCDFPVDLLETNIKENVDDIFDKIVSFSPDIIGFSVYIWNITVITKLTERIKSSTKAIVIWGGPEVCYDYEYFLSRFSVDFVAIGEGELTFNQFLHAINENSGFDHISGLAFKKENIVFATKPAETIDLTELKSPYRFQDDIAELPYQIQYLESSRGCPFHCSYCLASLENKVRFFPLDKVKDDLLFLIRNGARTFKFLDRTFNIDNKRAIELADFIIKNHLPGNSFQFEITGEILSDEFIDFINLNAPKHLFRFEIGIQSTNESSNLAVSRRQDNDRLFFVIRKIRQAGVIDLHLDLIAGLPYEDLDSFSKTFDAAFSLRAKELQLGFLKLLRGTPIRKNADMLGYSFNQDPPYEITESRWISKNDMKKIRQVEQALNIFWNKFFMTKTIEKIADVELSIFHFFTNLFLYCKRVGFVFHRYQLSDVFQVLNDYLCKTNPSLHDLVLPLMKHDYLSYHKIKPKIWWKEDKLERREVFRTFLEKNHDYKLDTLYKYGILATYGDLFLLAIYMPDHTSILLFGHDGVILSDLSETAL